MKDERHFNCTKIKMMPSIMLKFPAINSSIRLRSGLRTLRDYSCILLSKDNFLNFLPFNGHFTDHFRRTAALDQCQKVVS